jgi:hypothetical protein
MTIGSFHKMIITYFITVAFNSLSRHSIFLTYSTILGSPLKLRPHPHSFMQYPVRDSLQVLQNCHTLISLPGFPLKSGWKSVWHGIITFYMPKKNTSHLRCQGLPLAQAVAGPPWTKVALVSKCLDCSTQWNKSQGNNFLGDHMQAGFPRSSFFSRESLSNEFIFIYPRARVG